MTKSQELMTDQELDGLLAHATAPPLPLGARERLLARMAEEPTAPAMPGNVVALRRPVPARSRLGWLAGLPLAASLALGLYLGSGGTFDSYLPAAAYDVLAGATAEDVTTGIEDMESFTEDDLS